MDAILPNYKVLIVQLLTFALGMAAIWKLYIVSLRDHLKSRREGIVKDLASAQTAREEAEHLRGQLAADRAHMAADLKKAREEAREEVAALRAELLAKAAEQQEQMLKQARAQIQAESERAVAEVRGYAAALVVEATSVMVGKKLDSSADQALAKKLVAAVKISRN
ncbi:MAG TPA: ATP synthase F0 subunit B [bacterium]|jgi:F-type H+-transporting ATPase subunit b|nr:ATP synthase F0 subunit B [bacterium]